MTKYTHLVERCSSFLRTGVAWRLKEHGYTFSEAYWRLREGKGLVSLYDQESLKLWSDLITCVRRYTGALKPLSADDQSKLKGKRSEILERMERYRDRLEIGCVPQYLYDGCSPAILEHVLADMVGDVRGLDIDEQLRIWEELDMDNIRNEAKRIQQDIDIYNKEYMSVASDRKITMPSPEERTANCYGKRFIKDKVWQIRTGHDLRSSVNAEINKKLILIWDIPSLTGSAQRDVFHSNKTLLENYKKWKESNKGHRVEYDTMLSKVHEVLNGIVIPE